MENNQTINWKKQVNDRIGEISMKPEGKRVGNHQLFWWSWLNEAFEVGEDVYKRVLKDMRIDLAESKKAPRWDIDKRKVKPL